MIHDCPGYQHNSVTSSLAYLLGFSMKIFFQSIYIDYSILIKNKNQITLNKETLEKTEGAIKNGQTNVREDRRGNQEWANK